MKAVWYGLLFIIGGIVMWYILVLIIGGGIGLLTGGLAAVPWECGRG